MRLKKGDMIYRISDWSIGRIKDIGIITDIELKWNSSAYYKTTYSTPPPEEMYEICFLYRTELSGWYKPSTLSPRFFITLQEYEEKYGKSIKNW